MGGKIFLGGEGGINWSARRFLPFRRYKFINCTQVGLPRPGRQAGRALRLFSSPATLQELPLPREKLLETFLRLPSLVAALVRSRRGGGGGAGDEVRGGRREKLESLGASINSRVVSYGKKLRRF